MFDAIAARYDLLNRINSFGLDKGWRRKAVAALELIPGHKVLDLATGTGDLAIEIAKTLPTVEVVGLDPSKEMLAIGQRKVEAAGLGERVKMIDGDAQALPFEDKSFDRVTIAFGIRNVPDRKKALLEIHRVLRPNGRLVILELSEPQDGLFGTMGRFHLTTIVPRVGALLSGGDAYRYLKTSIVAFPKASDFKRTLEDAGFAVPMVEPLTFGACHLYSADRLG
jgi:demethylmenaquinone methyltransferase/2-methoxy-6-polyprenyl-1,4-benzoquinol methylase